MALTGDVDRHGQVEWWSRVEGQSSEASDPIRPCDDCQIVSERIYEQELHSKVK